MVCCWKRDTGPRLPTESFPFSGDANAPFPNRKFPIFPHLWRELLPPDWDGSFAEPQQTPVPSLLPPARADGVGNCRVSAGLQTEAMGADIPEPQTHTVSDAAHSSGSFTPRQRAAGVILGRTPFLLLQFWMLSPVGDWFSEVPFDRVMSHGHL